MDVLTFTFGLDTAFLVWKKIEEQLLPATKEKEIFLTDALMELKKGNSSLDDYVKKFNSLCGNLAAIGKAIPDLDKCFPLSRGLGQKYQDFRLAMLSKAPYPNFTQFVLALRSHEQVLLNHQIEEKEQIYHHQAYVSQCGRGRGRGGRFNSRGRGFGPAGRTNSSRPNNNSAWSSKPDSSKNHNSQEDNSRKNVSQNPVICQICTRPYQTTANCWNRYDFVDEQDDGQQALATYKETSDPNFYADSRANAHMTNEQGPKSADSSERT